MARRRSVDRELVGMSRRDYLEHALEEARRLRRGAEEAESWSAVERLAKSEREIKLELVELVQAEAARGGTDLDGEAAFESTILPLLHKWPRVFLERLMIQSAELLGVDLEPVFAIMRGESSKGPGWELVCTSKPLGKQKAEAPRARD